MYMYSDVQRWLRLAGSSSRARGRSHRVDRYAHASEECTYGHILDVPRDACMDVLLIACGVVNVTTLVGVDVTTNRTLHCHRVHRAAQSVQVYHHR